MFISREQFRHFRWNPSSTTGEDACFRGGIWTNILLISIKNVFITADMLSALISWQPSNSHVSTYFVKLHHWLLLLHTFWGNFVTTGWSPRGFDWDLEEYCMDNRTRYWWGKRGQNNWAKSVGESLLHKSAHESGEGAGIIYCPRCHSTHMLEHTYASICTF